MSDGKYHYHNEAIGIVAILSVLRSAKSLSYAKALLILPIVGHKSTISYLKKSNVRVLGLEELVAKRPGLFSNFNERYLSLLPISINSIVILNKLNFITLENGMINYKENDFGFENKGLGEFAKDVLQSSDKIAFLLKEEASNLYLQLRVSL